jgi:hypothetical protein
VKKTVKKKKTISQDIVTAIIKAPHSSPIKTEIKESTTATYWGHLYKPQNSMTQGTQNTGQNIQSYLLIIFCKSLTKASEELWPAPHRCSPVVLSFLFFQVFHPRGYTSDDRTDLAHHRLPGLSSERLYVGRPC